LRDYQLNLYSRTAALLFAFSMVAPLTLAHEDHHVTYDQIDLSARAEREVQTDLSIAMLYTEHEGQSQTDVAGRVNDTMAWALALAKPITGIKTQTAQYSTYPVYANNGTTVTGWRARQGIRLEARDTQVLGELIGALQEKLAVESIGSAVSKDTRDVTETALTDQALAQFQARAQQIAAALGRQGYRVVRINLGTGGEVPPPIAHSGELMMAEKSAGPAQIEGGTQRMSVTVSGTIQLDAKQ
jgi:predicted secreted protein